MTGKEVTISCTECDDLGEDDDGDQCKNCCPHDHIRALECQDCGDDLT